MGESYVAGDWWADDLVGLLDQVCPRDYRLILTISPVPLSATFTPSDVAVANSYSKSVLRAAVEPDPRSAGVVPSTKGVL